MNKTKWIIFVVAVVAIFGGVIWVNKKNDAPSFAGDANKIITEGPIPDNVYGSRDQKVTFIEYGDFQCPACGTMYQPVKDIVERYKDKVTFIFRNFPLTNIHPNALAAAAAAEAAGVQGKYWQMHDKLYETQKNWSNVAPERRTDVFAGLASEIGMNTDQFKSDISAANVNAKIDRDRATGRETFKVQGTPTFVLNGAVITGPEAASQEALQQKIEAAVKAAYPEQPAAPAQP